MRRTVIWQNSHSNNFDIVNASPLWCQNRWVWFNSDLTYTLAKANTADVDLETTQCDQASLVILLEMNLYEVYVITNFLSLILMTY